MRGVPCCVLVAGISETLRAEVKKYQDIVERLRLIALNKQQIQAQLGEINNALRELDKAGEGAAVYKVVGTVMISRKRDDVIRELNDLRETLEVRLKALEKQEDLLKKQLNQLEKKLARKLGGSAPGAG
ncbi:MAG: prefoldin subunit beta [Thermoprotei archaeon]|nr:MAG: prefoldin subunit beta [Thermoprotei archaeon]